jgi:hypothetical protein
MTAEAPQKKKKKKEKRSRYVGMLLNQMAEMCTDKQMERLEKLWNEGVCANLSAHRHYHD